MLWVGLEHISGFGRNTETIMVGHQPATDKILVALKGENAFVKVRGRGSFKVSIPLREFGLASIGMEVKNILLDMKDCIGMDSTFMGTIAGLSLRLRKEGDNGEVILYNLSPKTRNLLSTLGLDRIVSPYLAGKMPGEIERLIEKEEGYETLVQRRESGKQTTETMLDAHKTLVDIAPENLNKFRDVIDFLREDLHQNSES